MKHNTQDNGYMELAIEQARIGAKRGEVPIGAVIVQSKTVNGITKSRVISKAHNARERKQNALAHAEVLAIGKACKRLKSWRLDDCVMFVTLEPCPMCAGAILNARIGKVVIGALASPKDEKGGVDSFEIYKNNNLNWKTEVELDLRAECSAILKKFFAGKRKG